MATVDLNYNTCRNCDEPIVYGPWETWHHEELVACEEPEPKLTVYDDPGDEQLDLRLEGERFGDYPEEAWD